MGRVATRQPAMRVIFPEDSVRPVPAEMGMGKVKQVARLNQYIPEPGVTCLDTIW